MVRRGVGGAEVVKISKEVIKGKGKRGRKRKETALEAEELGPEAGLAHSAKEAIKGKRKRNRNRKGAAQDADELEPEAARMIESPKPWQAPVAYMGDEVILW